MLRKDNRVLFAFVLVQVFYRGPSMDVGTSRVMERACLCCRFVFGLILSTPLLLAVAPHRFLFTAVSLVALLLAGYGVFFIQPIMIR